MKKPAKEGWLSFKEQVAKAAEKAALKQFQSHQPGLESSPYSQKKRKTQRWKRTYLGRRGTGPEIPEKSE